MRCSVLPFLRLDNKTAQTSASVDLLRPPDSAVTAVSALKSSFLRDPQRAIAPFAVKLFRLLTILSTSVTRERSAQLLENRCEAAKLFPVHSAQSTQQPFFRRIGGAAKDAFPRLCQRDRLPPRIVAGRGT